MPSPRYPEFDQLFGAYLNQDYDLWGDTLDAVVGCYVRDSNPADLQALLRDIDRFEHAHPHDLDAAFLAAHGFDFDPSLWGLTTAAFFTTLRQFARTPDPGTGAA